jgi:hypothetical protein
VLSKQKLDKQELDKQELDQQELDQQERTQGSDRRMIQMRKTLFGGILLWAALIVASATLLLHPVFLQYLFLLRVPLLIGGLLIALPILANTLAKNLLQNLFVLHNCVELALVTLGTLFTGMGVVSVANTLLMDGADRFNLPQLEWVHLLSSYQWLFAIGIGLSTFIVVICLSIPEMAWLLGRDKVLKELLVGLGSGSFIGVVLLRAGDRITDQLESFTGLNQLLASLISLLPKAARGGYIDPNTGGLTSGHISAIGFFAAVMMIYLPLFFYGMRLYKPEVIPAVLRPIFSLIGTLIRQHKPSFEIPALFYLLIIFLLLVLLLSGLTFLLDFFRVPLLFVLLAISLTTYWLFNINHYYQLIHASGAEFTSKTFLQLLDHRFEQWEQTYTDLADPKPRTLVVICPAGGGIQAAGWTARVLTGLYEHPALGKPFMDAVGLISSVSGGTIGSMYFLDALANGTLEQHLNQTCNLKNPKTEPSNLIVRRATIDGLDAIGWGLAYTDLWRVIGLPFLSHPKLDRGVALETDWAEEFDAAKSPTLASWSKRVEAGAIPIPVFNATIVEDGSRLTISPIAFQEEGEQFKDFRNLYTDFDLSIATAARLSATFPYVSPICRNYPDLSGKNFHVADGGYFDNFGVFTAIQWLNDRILRDRATGKINPLNIKRVLFIEIRSFPEPSDVKTPPPEGPRGSLQRIWKRLRGEENLKTPGWKMTILGPLLTLFNVRNYTQAERNKVDIKDLKEQWEDKGKAQVEIFHHVIQFPRAKDLENPPPGWNLTEEQKQKMKKARLNEPPLSWKLTEAQKEGIEVAWDAVKETSLQTLIARWNSTT